MNQPHLHLLVNHIPLFGAFFGMIALIWAMIRKSNEMRAASIILFIVAGIFSFIASETGEHSEETVEHLPGVSEKIMHEHEEAAEAANVMITLTAVGAVLMAASMRFKPKLLKLTQIGVLVLSVVSSVLMARTANLGGQIRHTEIRAMQNSQAPETKGESPKEASEKHDDEDKD